MQAEPTIHAGAVAGKVVLAVSAPSVALTPQQARILSWKLQDLAHEAEGRETPAIPAKSA